MSRKAWPKFYLDLAWVYGQQATCPRAQVGCVLEKNNRVIGLGFNGAPSGWPHCTDVGCDIRDCQHAELHSGGHCTRATHAEENALINSIGNPYGATAYVSHQPCPDCEARLKAAGVKDIIWERMYP